MFQQRVEQAVRELMQKDPTALFDPRSFPETAVRPHSEDGWMESRAGTTQWSTAESGLVIPKSIVDAKGDLIVGTADNTVARKAVGSNGSRLTAYSGNADGTKWVEESYAQMVKSGNQVVGSGAWNLVTGWVTHITLGTALTPIPGSAVIQISRSGYYEVSGAAGFLPPGKNVHILGRLRNSVGTPLSDGSAFSGTLQYGATVHMPPALHVLSAGDWVAMDTYWIAHDGTGGTHTIGPMWSNYGFHIRVRQVYEA